MLKYFSYGSNMSAIRLGSRITKFCILGKSRLDRFDLRFHKASKDGSGKCDAFFTGNEEDFLLGVLYELADGEKVKLDGFEGLGFGYEERVVSVCLAGRNFDAVTYVATAIDESLVPYSWYLRHLIEGATAASFPVSYIRKLKSMKSQVDTNPRREERELSIYRQ